MLFLFLYLPLTKDEIAGLWRRVYDRTLSTLRAKKPILAIGIAYAYQQVAQIPIGPNDIPLDKIVTETKVF